MDPFQHLALHSPVFDAMFYGGYEEKEKKEIEIKDVDHEEFEELLHVLYPSFKPIKDDTVKFLLCIADRFEIKKITDDAEQFLMESDDFTVPQKFQIADQYRLYKLQNHCLAELNTARKVTAMKTEEEYKSLSDISKVALLEQIIRLMDEDD
ncbi:hypothetical protein PFISCL1PPCAC_21164 [Pristionchus fissidentatus]|uniref:BTB domain-containing protein n=1 Tax=Pristionchus fissidentatus TaxID=1538716 RepID=A0AAV5WC79_9BILA|nr:hypothetical protein PFISCL1PPCAC_21164 [Pristionchus fissidentatus]